MGLGIGVVCETGVGPARGGREANEDNFVIAAQGRVQMRHATRAGDAGSDHLVAVADGMGGLDGGERASREAVEAMLGLLDPDRRIYSARALLQFVRDTHRALHVQLQDGGRRPGTTLSLMRVFGDRACWVSVGDSRVYRLRGGALEQLSRDHTRNEFHRRDGTAPQGDGDRLCQAFVLGSRGLGFDSMIRLEPGLDADTILLRQGDVFLLSTDGVHEVLPPRTLAATMGGHAPQDAADRLARLAMDAGSTDNVTAIVVRVEGLLPSMAVPLGDDRADTIQF